MATEVISGPLGEVHAASTAGGGSSLSTTAKRIVLPIGTKWVGLLPRNFSTAVVCKFNFNPWLTVLKTTDALATETNLTDYSYNAQDSSTSTKITLDSLDTASNKNYLFVGSHLPFSGVDIDVNNTNSTGSVLTVKYWDGSAWTDISATDNTASGGATFAVDGTVVWTVPTAWAMAGLKDAMTGVLAHTGIFTEPLFWTRWEVGTQLDSSTDLNSAIAINRSTAYGELVSGQAFEEAVTVGPGGICSVVALTDAGTANLIVNASTRAGGRFA